MRTVVIMIVALAVGFFVGSSQLVKQTKVEPQPSPPPQAVEKAKGLTLPAAAKKLSDCVPNMGEHWGNPANLSGPFYLVDKDKVVGLEYMTHEDELEKNIISIGQEKVGKPVMMPAMGVAYDHMELNYMPEGHEGDKEPHYDVHMYLITSDEQQNLCS